jgi:hypothetical protein
VEQGERALAAALAAAAAAVAVAAMCGARHALLVQLLHDYSCCCLATAGDAWLQLVMLRSAAGLCAVQ